MGNSRSGDAASGLEAAAVSQAGERRSARIESLRALAALGVLVSHSLGQGIGFTAALATYPRRIVFGGGFGVFLFFGLSGYLLFRPFVVRDVGGGQAIDLRRYALNRALRILPLYYAVLFTFLAVDHELTSGNLWLRFATFTQTYSNATVAKVDGPMWSLSCEILFYALLPLVALGIAALARGSALHTAIVLAVAGTALLVLREVTVVHASPAPQWRYSFPANAVFFVPGMLVAVLQTAWRQGRPGWVRGPLASSTVWLLAAVACWLVVFHDYSRDEVIMAAVFLTVGACVLPLQAGSGVRALEWRPLALLGVASYSLYLWHFRIVSALPSGSSWRHFLVVIAIAAPICIAVAFASYHLVEKPWLGLRRRWADSGTATQEAGTGARRTWLPRRAGGRG